MIPKYAADSGLIGDATKTYLCFAVMKVNCVEGRWDSGRIGEVHLEILLCDKLLRVMPARDFGVTISTQATYFFDLMPFGVFERWIDVFILENTSPTYHTAELGSPPNLSLNRLRNIAG
jgi:hypothetical protein